MAVDSLTSPADVRENEARAKPEGLPPPSVEDFKGFQKNAPEKNARETQNLVDSGTLPQMDLFNITDLNDDGTVNQKEFEYMFRMMDGDSDRSLARGEFNQFFVDLGAPRQSDGDGDGGAGSSDGGRGNGGSREEGDGGDCGSSGGASSGDHGGASSGDHGGASSGGWTDDASGGDQTGFENFEPSGPPPIVADGTGTYPDRPPVSFDGELNVNDGRGRVAINGRDVPAELQKYVTVDASGRMVIDGQGDQLPPLLITGDNVSIQNARFGNSSGRLIDVQGGHNVTIRNCELGGTQDEAIWTQGASNTVIENNYLHDIGKGLEDVNSDGTVFSGNYVLNPNGVAAQYYHSTNGKILNNTSIYQGRVFDHGHWKDGGVEDHFSILASSTEVIGNYIEGHSGSASGSGITIEERGPKPVLVQGNILKNASKNVGIQFAGGDGWAIGNHVDNEEGDGIRWGYTFNTSTEWSVIENNYVRAKNPITGSDSVNVTGLETNQTVKI